MPFGALSHPFLYLASNGLLQTTSQGAVNEAAAAAADRRYQEHLANARNADAGMVIDGACEDVTEQKALPPPSHLGGKRRTA